MWESSWTYKAVEFVPGGKVFGTHCTTQDEKESLNGDGGPLSFLIWLSFKPNTRPQSPMMAWPKLTAVTLHGPIMASNTDLPLEREEKADGG